MSDEHGRVSGRGFLRTTATAAVAGTVGLSARQARAQKKAVTLKVLARDYRSASIPRGAPRARS